MPPQFQVPGSVQAVLKRLQLPPEILAATLTALGLIVASALLANSLTPAPGVQPEGEFSAIQVVKSDGRSAGVCAIGGLEQEKVHYTNKDSVYYWRLQPHTNTIEASCPSVTALSSGRTYLEGKAAVTVTDKPQVVRIVVR